MSLVSSANMRARFLLLLIVVASACSPGSGQRAQFLSIATGGTGGVYYPYGGGVAKVLNEHLPGVRATAEVTAASVDNLKLIRDGRADLAFTLADTLADAVRALADTDRAASFCYREGAPGRLVEEHLSGRANHTTDLHRLLSLRCVERRLLNHS